MSRTWVIRVAVALGVIGLTMSAATADEGAANLSARLSGFSEVPPNLTTGSGSFHATIRDNTLTYTVSYSNLSTPAIMSHIHFAQPGVNGGIFIWLCGSATSPATLGPAGTPTCPAAGGTVTRTVTATDVVAVTPQGVTAGDFAGVMRIIRNGEGYVNVHTTAHPGGEIRGQVDVGDG
jgi:CHRD domain